jgi:hypothetical protein
MMVKIVLEIEVEDGFDIQNLKEWVAAEDEIASGKGQGIAAENVQPMDIFDCLMTSAIDYKVTKQEITEA